MSMTREERNTKEYIQNKLAKEGYPTYASLFGNFDLNLTQDPMTVGFMEPSKGRIVLNRGLDEDQVSTIVRHEILHQYLEHERRLLKHLADEHNLDFNKVDDNSLKDLKNKLYSNDLFNRAADYEISNRGYTDKDKDNVRNILLNGEILNGLVTEDDHPDWIDLSVEEMYDKLREEAQQNNEDQEDSGDQNQQDQEDQSQQSQSNSSDSGQSQQDQQQQDLDDSDDQQGSDGSSSQDQQNDQQDQEQSSGSGSSDEQEGGEESKGSSSDSQSDQQGDQEQQSSSNSDDESGSDSDSQSQKGGPGADSAEKPKTNRRPQIGERGDEETLAREDAEREKQAKEDAEKYGDQEESDLSREERLKKIERDLQDQDILKKAGEESEEKIKKERAVRAARDAKKYQNSPIKKFRDNLNRFIKNEVGREKVRTWKREDPRYEGTGIMRRGKARVSSGKIPSINVYFDRSGSWDAAKTKVGMDAIGTLNNYVRQGQIKINLYYFNTEIHSEDPGGRGGTWGTPIINHIKQTKPDNVIIMTDDDITDIDESVTVPGAVWLLFKGGQSRNLIDHIHGAKQTNIYNLE